MTVKFPLPEPYEGGTPQDHIDALTDYADVRIDGPLLDYLAMAAADLIKQQQDELKSLHAQLSEIRQMAARFDTFGDSGRTRAFVGDIARIAQVTR